MFAFYSPTLFSPTLLTNRLPAHLFAKVCTDNRLRRPSTLPPPRLSEKATSVSRRCCLARQRAFLAAFRTTCCVKKAASPAGSAAVGITTGWRAIPPIERPSSLSSHRSTARCGDRQMAACCGWRPGRRSSGSPASSGLCADQSWRPRLCLPLKTG
jgi:hypothetical protein